MDHDYTPYLMAAITWARQAGSRQLDFFRSHHLDMRTKSNTSDVVTAADHESEHIILDSIRRDYPEHSILSEEAGVIEAANNTDSSWQWVVDPLDGTTNFSQGLPIFSISIALRHRGRTVVGVVYAPYLNELFHAVLHGGAFLNGHAIQCSQKTEWNTAVLATGMPYDKAVNPDNNLDNVARIAPQVRGVRRLGSAAIDLCYVAAGFFDGYWELNLNPWDVDAGELIASEAGARTGRFRNDRGESVYAAAPAIAPKLLRRLSRPNH